MLYFNKFKLKLVISLVAMNIRNSVVWVLNVFNKHGKK